MKTKTRTAALPFGIPAKFLLAAAAIILALLAMPQFGHAQGIVRGAQEGSREGNRVAGPVGGRGGRRGRRRVGGAMGAVKGVFGINDRGHRFTLSVTDYRPGRDHPDSIAHRIGSR